MDGLCSIIKGMSDSIEVLSSLLNSPTSESETAILSLSSYLISIPLGQSSFDMYSKILYRNIPKAADILLTNKNPASFFSVIPMNKNVISFALSTLSDYTYAELYTPIAETCLGVCIQCYNNPSHGMKIYNLSVAEIYHISKYLMKKDPTIVHMIQDFLEDLIHLEDFPELSRISRNILDFSLDNSKSLSQIIPPVILHK